MGTEVIFQKSQNNNKQPEWHMLLLLIDVDTTGKGDQAQSVIAKNYFVFDQGIHVLTNLNWSKRRSEI